MTYRVPIRFSKRVLTGAFAAGALSFSLLAGSAGGGPLGTAVSVPGFAATPAEASETRGCPPQVSWGSRGAAVRELQRRLNSSGGGAKLAVDGDFGPLTLARVKDFQGDRGLAVDGIVGPDTWNALGACGNPISKPPPR